MLDDRNATNPIDALSLPPAVPRARGFEVCICYTRDHLQRGGLIVSVIADLRALDILRTEHTVAKRRVSDQAILSFATILFGQKHRQSDIARRGYAMYSVALTQLNQALTDAMQHTSDEVIVAVATLAISECLLPSGKNNYLNHMMGLQRLVDLQEPRAFWPSKPYGFRDGVRFMLLFASVLLRKPCILARAEWKSALRVNSSPAESREQDLYDVVADCTVMLAKCDGIVATWELDVIRATEQAREVEDQGRALLAQLRAWRSIWDDEMASDTFEITWSPPSSDSLPSLITGRASTPSRMVQLMLFDVALTTVLQILASLPCEALPRGGSLRSASASLTQSAREYYASQERLAASEACRCIRAFVEGGGCLNARVPPVLHWAVATAWKSLRYDSSVEGIWLQELMSVKGRGVVADGLWENYQWLESVPNLT